MGVMYYALRPFILNDILTFSKYCKEYLRHLDDILSTFEREQLYCKAGKCFFATDSVKRRGLDLTPCLVTSEGIVLSFTNVSKYLGVWIDDALTCMEITH